MHLAQEEECRKVNAEVKDTDADKVTDGWTDRQVDSCLRLSPMGCMSAGRATLRSIVRKGVRRKGWKAHTG